MSQMSVTRVTLKFPVQPMTARTRNCRHRRAPPPSTTQASWTPACAVQPPSTPTPFTLYAYGPWPPEARRGSSTPLVFVGSKTYVPRPLGDTNSRRAVACTAGLAATGGRAGITPSARTQSSTRSGQEDRRHTASRRRPAGTRPSNGATGPSLVRRASAASITVAQRTPIEVSDPNANCYAR
jgi:hypothetical protein